MEYFDTHCHLNHSDFCDDLLDVVARAEAAGVRKFVVPGWDVPSSERALDLAYHNPKILAAVGIHPNDWQTANQDSIQKIIELAHDPHVAAIGEIGLDFHYDTDHHPAQEKLLQQMLEIANLVSKPVLLHSRESIQELTALIADWNFVSTPGILHSFEGNLEQANILARKGFKLGIGGPLTYKNSGIKKSVFSMIPDDAIVLETDAPYLPPTPFRGKRNEPSYLPIIAKELTNLRGQKELDLMTRIYENSNKIFLQEFVH